MKSISEPETVKFDDEILQCCSAIMKKRKTTSHLMTEILSFLPAIFKKNCYRMGQMLDTLTLFTVYHPKESWTQE